MAVSGTHYAAGGEGFEPLPASRLCNEKPINCPSVVLPVSCGLQHDGPRFAWLRWEPADGASGGQPGFSGHDCVCRTQCATRASRDRQRGQQDQLHCPVQFNQWPYAAPIHRRSNRRNETLRERRDNGCPRRHGDDDDSAVLVTRGRRAQRLPRALWERIQFSRSAKSRAAALHPSPSPDCRRT